LPATDDEVRLALNIFHASHLEEKPSLWPGAYMDRMRPALNAVLDARRLRSRAAPIGPRPDFEGLLRCVDEGAETYTAKGPVGLAALRSILIAARTQFDALG
jgi:hypothetical protein